MNGQMLENPVILPFCASGVVFVIVLIASLSNFVSPLLVLVPLALSVLLWALIRNPLAMLGVVLAFMPFDFMAVALGKFLGLPHMTLVSVCTKEIPLLLVAALLWGHYRFKATVPDWFLLACFLLALTRTVLGGTLGGFALDLDFVIPYAVGRVTVLSLKQETIWARCAIWIAAVLSVAGMFEVFVLGETPRTLLYLAIDSETEGGKLTSPFHAAGFTGLRESATMVGPNGFAALCMIALVIWWVYSRNPAPAGMIAGGLICTVTRSAWLGTAVAIPLIAVMMGQKKRLLSHAVGAFVLFLTAIPLLDLGDYLHYNRTRQEISAEYHGNEILEGLEYDVEHPFGSGNVTISPTLSKENTDAIFFETTYPAFAAAYGIPAALCLLGFLYTSLRLLWRSRTPLGCAAVGVLVGMCVVMTFTNSLIDRRLICWAWFPVGLAIRSSVSGAMPESKEQQEMRGAVGA